MRRFSPGRERPLPINAPIFERGERVRMIVEHQNIPVPSSWIRPANRSGYVGCEGRATSAPVKIEPAARKNSERGVKRR